MFIFFKLLLSTPSHIPVLSTEASHMNFIMARQAPSSSVAKPPFNYLPPLNCLPRGGNLPLSLLQGAGPIIPLLLFLSTPVAFTAEHIQSAKTSNLPCYNSHQKPNVPPQPPTASNFPYFSLTANRKWQRGCQDDCQEPSLHIPILHPFHPIVNEGSRKSPCPRCHCHGLQ